MEELFKTGDFFEQRRKNIIEELENSGITDYYFQMFDEKLILNKRLDLLMKYVGADPAKLGYTYLKDAMKMIIRSGEYKKLSATEIYSSIATKRKTTSSAVERCIRTLKDDICKNMCEDVGYLVFGNVSYKKIPANFTFIYELVYFLQSFTV